MKKLFLLLLSAALLAGCQKPDEARDTDQPTPTPQPTLPADTAKTILLNTRDEDASGNLYATLTAFNSNGTQKWKRTQLGTSSNPYLTYHNGVVYISVSYFQFANGGSSFVSYNNLYAINAETGANVWAKTNSNDYVYSMVARNDTLYCSLAYGSSNFIAAYSTTNGGLLWLAPIAFPYPAARLALDGGMLYFGTASSNTVNNIIGFDIGTKIIKWNTPIGINFANVFSNLVLHGNAVFLKNGTGNLLALDKLTGATLWSKTDQTYEQPVVDNNIIFSASQNGLQAFSASNGNPVWQWNGGNWFKGGFPFVADKRVYIAGSQAHGFITCFNAASGTVEWKKEMADVLQYPLVAADKLILLRTPNLNGTPPHILIYDAKTGAAKDSIPISAREYGQHSIVTGLGKWIHGY